MSEFFLKKLPENFQELCDLNLVGKIQFTDNKESVVKTGEEYIYMYKSGKKFGDNQLCHQRIITEGWGGASFDAFFGHNFYVYKVIKDNKKIRKVV